MNDKNNILKITFPDLENLENKNTSLLKQSKFNTFDNDPPTSLKDVFNHVAKGKRGPAPPFVPSAPPVFDPDKVEMKTKRKLTAPKTAKWRKRGRGTLPDPKRKPGKDRRGGGKPPGG